MVGELSYVLYQRLSLRVAVQGSVTIRDNGVHENKIGIELIKEAASESELNSIYLTQLLHDVDRSFVLTLTVVRSATRRIIHIIHIIILLYWWFVSTIHIRFQHSLTVFKWFFGPHYIFIVKSYKKCRTLETTNYKTTKNLQTTNKKCLYTGFTSFVTFFLT